VAVINGFLVASNSIGGFPTSYLTADFDSYSEAWVGTRAKWLSPASPGAQTITSNLPVSTTPYVKSGTIATSYFDDYYNRIHIQPPRIDLGNLLSVQTRQATVWNAYLTPQGLGAILESGTEGITESGVAAPTVFAPLEERVFTLNVDTEGPATIDALYTFIFSSEAPELRATGRRVVVFGYAPNWSEPVREKLSWLTDVLLTQSGIEQRVGLRGIPRRALSYSLLTQDRLASAKLETILLGWQSRLYALPVWTERQVLAAPLTAGVMTIPCQTTDYEFAPNGLALLWRAHDQHEAVEIASVGASSITLKSPTVSAWPAGTRLYPVRLARLPQRQKFARETNHHLSGTVEFEMADSPAIAALDTGDTYAGYRVYAGGTNWAEPVEIEAMRQLDVLDYDTGAPWVDDLSGIAALLKSWHWTLGSRAEIVALKKWLAAREGRRVPFWSPTQAEDLKIMAPIGSSAVSITVENIGYARYLAGRADRRHIMIETLAGQRFYRSITASSEIDDATEQITIDSALGVTLQPADIKSARFLHLTRLESDEVEIAWHSLALAECSTMLRSLPQ
jgi:hypothetical protein